MINKYPPMKLFGKPSLAFWIVWLPLLLMSLIYAWILLPGQLVRALFVRVPFAVEIKYEESSGKKDLRKCTKTLETTYIVVSSHGTGGASFYFNSAGHSIGTLTFSDLPPLPGTPVQKPPIDEKTYDCRILRQYPNS